MSIPMPPIELLKEGRVIDTISCTASYGNTHKVEDAVRWLKGWHEVLQDEFVANKETDGRGIRKDYDAMRVKWFNENIVTWYLTGQALLDGEVLNGRRI